jgi:hypothetical protein
LDTSAHYLAGRHRMEIVTNINTTANYTGPVVTTNTDTKVYGQLKVGVGKILGATPNTDTRVYGQLKVGVSKILGANLQHRYAGVWTVAG